MIVTSSPIALLEVGTHVECVLVRISGVSDGVSGEKTTRLMHEVWY